MSLPFTRSRLIVLVGAVNYFAVTVSSILSFALYYSVTALVLKPIPGNSIPSSSTIPQLSGKETVGPISHFFDGHWLRDPLEFGTAMLAVSVSALIFLFAWDQQAAAKRLAANRARGTTKNQVFGILAAYVLIPLVGFLIFKSLFILLSLLLAFLAFFTAVVVSGTWIFSPPRRIKWVRSFLLISFFQVAAMYIVAYSATGSGSVDSKIRGIEFLGVAGPKLSAQLLRDSLSGPVEWPVASRIYKLVAPRDYKGRYLDYRWGATEGVPPLRDLIGKQHDFSVIAKLVDLYNPAVVTQDDLLVVSKNHLSSGTKDVWWRFPSDSTWASIHLSDDLVNQFLKSGEPAKMNLALRYIEFHPGERFVNPVVESLRTNLKGEQIPIGVFVLSELEGRKLDLRSYLERIRAGSKNTYWDVDCSKAEVESLLSLKDSKDEPFFNRCLRVVAASSPHPKLVSRIRWWYSLPLSDEERNEMRQAWRY